MNGERKLMQEGLKCRAANMNKKKGLTHVEKPIVQAEILGFLNWGIITAE